MVLVLTSRWGLEPVVVAAASSGDERSPLPEDDTSRDRSRTATTAMAEPLAAATTIAAAAQPSDMADEQEDDELTGRTLWDCAQVLWNLVADPNPTNEFAVRGKHVIELGGGTGALSVGLARAGAASVTCTDLPCHLARIESTIRENFRASTSASVASHDRASGSSGGDSGGGGSFGGGGDGGEAESGFPNHGRHPAATAASAAVPAVAAREPRVCVAALRWGDEEDLARMRAPPGGGSCRGGGLAGEKQVDGGGLCSSTHEKRASRGDGSSRSSSACNRCSSSPVLGVDGDTAVATGVPQPSDDKATTTATTAAVGVPDGAHATEPRHTDGGGGRTGGDRAARESAAAAVVVGCAPPPACFDVIVLSEVLYWPALDLLEEDTREPLRRTLVGLSEPGTKVILIYKERWPQREQEFLRSCEESFRVGEIPSSLLALPAATGEEPGSAAIRAVVMIRLYTRSDEENSQ